MDLSQSMGRDDALRGAEVSLGLRCKNCEEPVEPMDLEYLMLSPVLTDEGTRIASGRVVICRREACDEARADVESRATAARPCLWEWPGEPDLTEGDGEKVESLG